MAKFHLVSLILALSVSGSTISCSRVINPSKSIGGLTLDTDSMSQAELKSYILKESQPGGKLDFFTPIKGHEYEGKQIKPGIYANGLEFALYSWGHSVRSLGIKIEEEAFEIYSEFKGESATSMDKSIIKLGFDEKPTR